MINDKNCTNAATTVIATATVCLCMLAPLCVHIWSCACLLPVLNTKLLCFLLQTCDSKLPALINGTFVKKILRCIGRYTAITEHFPQFVLVRVILQCIQERIDATISKHRYDGEIIIRAREVQRGAEVIREKG